MFITLLYTPCICPSPLSYLGIRGIGRTAANRNRDFNGVPVLAYWETYRTSTGHKIAMPIYWRNKIYNDEEREKL